jgi:hypothetical protein
MLDYLDYGKELWFLFKMEKKAIGGFQKRSGKNLFRF